jgi:hypothetical protein
MSFVNGISFRITGGMADSDTTSASTGDCAINLGYKWAWFKRGPFQVTGRTLGGPVGIDRWARVATA